MYIEFIGPPGSGKSFFFRRLSKFFLKTQIAFETPKEVFINLYLNKKTHSSKIKKYLFQYYFKHINITSNLVFKKETDDLKKFIKKEIQSSKEVNTLVKLFYNFLKHRQLPKSLSERMILNFKIDCIGIIKKKHNRKVLICEEGIYQKFYLNFKYSQKKNLKKKIFKILKDIKQPKIIFFFNYDINSSINRAKKRNKGFKYFIKKEFILDKNNFFNNYLLEFAKKKKIKILDVYKNNKVKINLNENFTRRIF